MLSKKSKTYLTVKYGSLNSALSKWLTTPAGTFNEHDDQLLHEYAKEILPNLDLVRNAKK